MEPTMEMEKVRKKQRLEKKTWTPTYRLSICIHILYYIISYHIIWYHIISYQIILYLLYYIILYMCVCHMVICTYCLDDTFWVWVKLQKAKIAGNVGCFDANLRRPKASVSQCVSRWPRSRPVKKCWLVSKIWNCTPSHASSWLFL